jgi:ribulose-phosphate 3-epimerase
MSRSPRAPRLSPSLMCADFLDLGKELRIFEDFQVPMIHIDVMDGHYVPNFTLGPDICAAVAGATAIPLDIHLMIENVDAYAPVFAKFNAPWICFHPETSYHPLRTLSLLRSCGARPGIAIDPSMSLESCKYLLPEVDLVCVMAVNPGYAGQKLIPSSLGKIAELRDYLDREGLVALLEVDGNVSWDNIPAMVEAGADLLVAGSSSVFSRAQSREESMRRMRGLLDSYAPSPR